MTPERPNGTDASRISVERAVPTVPGTRPLYAALDLGTNSCRMLIAEPTGSQFSVVDSFSKSVQLGLGLETSGALSNASIQKAVHALKICGQKLDQHNVVNKRLVATEACRRARNGPAFLRRVEREAGLSLEVITPEEEAWLAVVSCAPLVAKSTDQLLVVDIGGGSTELVWVDLSGVSAEARTQSIVNLRKRFDSALDAPHSAKVVDWISVPLGVATLREQFNDVRDDGARFALMSCYFEEALQDFTPSEFEQSREGFQIIGTSGTITTVAASHLGLRRYDRNKVDGLRMTSDEIDAVVRQYLALGPVGRRQDPRIGRERHALIMSGAAILQALLRLWPTDRLSVADRGLREGILYSQMANDGVLSGHSE